MTREAGKGTVFVWYHEIANHKKPADTYLQIKENYSGILSLRVPVRCHYCVAVCVENFLTSYNEVDVVVPPDCLQIAGASSGACFYLSGGQPSGRLMFLAQTSSGIIY